jgi:hypothetical protein
MCPQKVTSLEHKAPRFERRLVLNPGCVPRPERRPWAGMQSQATFAVRSIKREEWEL